MQKSWLIAAALLVILAAGAVYYFTTSQPVQPQPSFSVSDDNNEVIEKDEPASDSGIMSGETKTFSVEGKSFQFTPSELRVKKGDKVKVTFKNTGGFHDLTIEGYDVATKQISAGSEDIVEFVADKTGTFELFCSVGNHRAQGMKGSLIVE